MYYSVSDPPLPKKNEFMAFDKYTLSEEGLMFEICMYLYVFYFCGFN